MNDLDLGKLALALRIEDITRQLEDNQDEQRRLMGLLLLLTQQYREQP